MVKQILLKCSILPTEGLSSYRKVLCYFSHHGLWESIHWIVDCFVLCFFYNTSHCFIVVTLSMLPSPTIVFSFYSHKLCTLVKFLPHCYSQSPWPLKFFFIRNVIVWETVLFPLKSFFCGNFLFFWRLDTKSIQSPFLTWP